MARTYRRKTGQLPADRQLRLRATRSPHVDVQKVAEVLIRIALREADDRQADSQDVGVYLREHLSDHH